jgi:hypothetical protein
MTQQYPPQPPQQPFPGQPYQAPQQPAFIAPPPPKKGRGKVVLGVAGGVLALLVVGGIVQGAQKPAATPAAPVTSASADHASASATPTEAATPDAPAAYTPTKDDFVVGVKVKKKECFGSAGCLITFRIDPTYIGDDLADGSSVEVTYKVKGAEGGYTNTFTMDSDGTAHLDSAEDIQTASSKTKLSAIVTDVDFTP